MATERDEARGYIGSLIDFGRVTASKLSASVKNVLVSITGLEDESASERRSDQPLYGCAAVMLRPKSADANGAFEVVFVRHEEQLVPIAHRETRWQVDLEEGEVVVRAFGDGAARVRLKPNGDAILEATRILLGSSGASEGVPLGDSLKTWLAAHTHDHSSLTCTGGTIGGTIGAPLTSPPNPSSKVKVE